MSASLGQVWAVVRAVSERLSAMGLPWHRRIREAGQTFAIRPTLFWHSKRLE